MENSTTYKSIINLFEEQVELKPNHTAVVGAGKKFSYKALNEKANCVANTLISLGIKPEERVLIYLPRVIENYVANLGIMKAGGAFVNTSVSYPHERIVSIFEQSSSRFIITNKVTLNENADLFRELNVVPLLIEQLMSGDDKSNPNLNIESDRLCYVIFTSGSTGKPKGVMIEHGNIANFLLKDSSNTESYIIYKNATVLLAVAQFTFDMSIMEEFLAFAGGMTLVMATDAEILDASALNMLLSENHVDALIVTPAYLNMLVEIPLMRNAIANIKVMDFGAEAFPPALYDKIKAINEDVVIINGYGPTEATISCTVKVLTSGNDITIGYPNENVYAFIVDENLNELERGQEGELLICGNGVGRGYMNLPEITAKSFVSFRGMKAYRTGDFAVMRPDGEIEYRGRRDFQVKIRGLRIELGEIEQIMLAHPGVSLCAATVFDNSLLVLYYTGSDVFYDNEIEDYARKNIANYMLPDKFIRLDEMPMTSNLKIDRNALPKPKNVEEKTVLPTNELEEKLLNILMEIEPDMPKSIEANILNTGISSLGLMGLMAMIEDEFMVRVSTGDIFENPSVVKLEQFIINSKRREVFREHDRYPVSKSQMTSYLDHVRRPKDKCWNLNYYYEMPLTIDVNRLAKAITGAFVIHPELLSTFKTDEEGVLWQIPADDELIFKPQIINISDEEWENMKPSLGKAFDLAGGELLFEVNLYVTPSKIVLYVDFAHLIIDGDSLDIFLRDMSLIYEKKNVEPEEMSAFQLIFEEQKQREAFGDDCRKYYEALMGKDAVIRSIRPHMEDGKLNSVIMRPFKTSMSELKKIGEKYKISVNVVASGVFGYVLAKEEGLNDSIHTVSYDNRYDSDLKNTAGFLCRNLPMYCHIGNGISWKDYYSVISDQMRRNLIYPATAENYMSETIPNYTDNLVILQTEMNDDFVIDGMTAKGNMVQHAIEESTYRIVIQLFPMGDTLIAVMVIDTKLYDEAYGNHFLDMMDETFEKALSNTTMD